MIKSELITAITQKQPYLNQQDIEQVVKCIVNKMTEALGSGDRIEIRGFGSFSLVERLPSIGRNPRTGERVSLPKRHSVRFKAGLELAKRVRDSVQAYPLKSNNE
jgi:integration host factor subunit beta